MEREIWFRGCGRFLRDKKKEGKTMKLVAMAGFFLAVHVPQEGLVLIPRCIICKITSQMLNTSFVSSTINVPIQS